MIEVFVRSFTPYIDVIFYREMSQHIQCGLSRWVQDVLSKEFKGRILSREDLNVLEPALEIARTNDVHVKVYDVSRITDKLTALKRGIRKTPVVIINGRKYERVEEILEALQTISSKPNL